MSNKRLNYNLLSTDDLLTHHSALHVILFYIFSLLFQLIPTTTVQLISLSPTLGSRNSAWVSSDDGSSVEIDENQPHSTLQIKTYEGKRMLIK